jgi:hypothetical protein
MRRIFASMVFVGLLAACSGSGALDPGDGTDSADSDDEGTDGSELRASQPTRVTLNFEGTCDFLRQCSTFSKNPPEPDMVQWGCEGWKVCSDDDYFLAGPSRVAVDGRSVRACGRRMQVCRPNGPCITATVRDVSDRSVWEASPGVFEALGLDYGLHARCSGFGRGTVTLKPL